MWCYGEAFQEGTMCLFHLTMGDTHTLAWRLSPARRDAGAFVGGSTLRAEGSLVSPAKPCLAAHRQELAMIYCKAAQALAL